jgi:hypothetical protein
MVFGEVSVNAGFSKLVKSNTWLFVTTAGLLADFMN